MHKSSSRHLSKYQAYFHDNPGLTKALFLASLFLSSMLSIDANSEGPNIPDGGLSDALKRVGKGADDIGKGVVTFFVDTANTIRSLETVGGQAFKSVEKAGGDIIQTTVKAGNDLTATYTKAWADGTEQARRSLQDTIDAANALGNYASNQTRDLIEAGDKAVRRAQEGKYVDAMWHLGTDPLQASEKNFAKATQESSLINDAVQATASAYGPGGAAAYTAWATYRSTGDADLAFRRGIESAAMSQTGSPLSKNIPSGTAGELLKKSAMAGALGGIAVAAAGGDKQAVEDAFLKSSGAVLIQGSTDKLKAFSPKAKNAVDMIHCISAKDVDCISNTTYMRKTKEKLKGRILFDNNGNPLIDPKKLDPQQYIGRWTAIDLNSREGQTLAFISKISKLPKVEAIPLKNNQWVLTWTLGRDKTIEYGKPAVVLTYVGENVPFISKVEYGDFTDGMYACPVNEFVRTVKTTKSEHDCKTIYKKEGGVSQVIWHSHNNPESCAAKAAAFVTHLAERGTYCSPVSEAGVTEETTIRVTGTVEGKQVGPFATEPVINDDPERDSTSESSQVHIIPVEPYRK